MQTCETHMGSTSGPQSGHGKRRGAGDISLYDLSVDDEDDADEHASDDDYMPVFDNTEEHVPELLSHGLAITTSPLTHDSFHVSDRPTMAEMGVCVFRRGVLQPHRAPRARLPPAATERTR